MQESVIDVLFYLFDDLLPEYDRPETDLDEMAHWLNEAGFRQAEVGRAMQWFYDFTCLVDAGAAAMAHSHAVRIFADAETRWLDADAQDYLQGLVSRGVLDNVLREKVIERLLALEERLDMEAVRWVTSLVILNVAPDHLPEKMALQEEWLCPPDERVVH